MTSYKPITEQYTGHVICTRRAVSVSCTYFVICISSQFTVPVPVSVSVYLVFVCLFVGLLLCILYRKEFKKLMNDKMDKMRLNVEDDSDPSLISEQYTVTCVNGCLSLQYSLSLINI